MSPQETQVRPEVRRTNPAWTALLTATVASGCPMTGFFV